MKIAGRSIMLTALLMHLLPGNTNASTSSVSYDLSSRNILNQSTDRQFSLLFAQQTEDSTKSYTPSSLRLKSPYMAIFYSVIPGFVLHGSGHVYAGKIPTAIILFGSELAGIGLMVFGSIGEFEAGNLSDREDYSVFLGQVLFVASWLYDVIESPVAVQKRNRKLREQNPIGLEFQMKDKEPVFSVVWRF